MEQWKEIDGFNGAYQVSDSGKIRSKPRKVWNGYRWVMTKGKILKPNVLNKGYLQVCLYNGTGKRNCLLVHRLVALSFVSNPNRNEYTQVNHIDGNKQNNHAANLEWCDNSLNQLHAFRIGLSRHNPNSGKKKRIVLQIEKETGRILKRWQCISDVMRHFGDRNNSNLLRVLNKRPHYNTLCGDKCTNVC